MLLSLNSCKFDHSAIYLKTLKSSVNTEEKILNYLSENPIGTISELSDLLRLTTRAIEKQIANLKKKKRLELVGSARKDSWKIIR